MSDDMIPITTADEDRINELENAVQEANTRADKAARQLVDANAEVAALTGALTTRWAAYIEERDRADEAERQLSEANAGRSA